MSHPTSAPTRSLPARVSLQWLRKQAKELLKTYRAGDAAAERKPLVGRVVSLQKPIGTELVWLRVQVFPAMHEVTARAQHDTGRVLSAARRERLLHQPHNERHDGANSQALSMNEPKMRDG